MNQELFNTMSAYNNLFLDNPHGVYKEEFKTNQIKIAPIKKNHLLFQNFLTKSANIDQIK